MPAVTVGSHSIVSQSGSLQYDAHTLRDRRPTQMIDRLLPLGTLTRWTAHQPVARYAKTIPRTEFETAHCARSAVCTSPCKTSAGGLKHLSELRSLHSRLTAAAIA